MIEALQGLRAARRRKEKMLARDARPEARQQVAHTQGGDTAPEGGQDQASGRCGRGEKNGG